MSVERSTFESIVLSRFVTLTFPNPCKPNRLLHTPIIRVAVHDSPYSAAPGKVAFMFVPLHRESDWTFSTEAGHLQILLSATAQLSRLILVGNLPACPHPTSFDRPLPMDDDSIVLSNVEGQLAPLLFALLPKWAFPPSGLPQFCFLKYDDDVVRSVVVGRSLGLCVGEMLTEDVQLDAVGWYDGSHRGNEFFRRRLRFKRMPNLIQTQMPIYFDTLKCTSSRDLKETPFRVDNTKLVQSYLVPMVGGLSLISSHLDEKIQCGVQPKALCLGVGGGALLGFLNSQLGFEVLGVEADKAVLKVAKEHFGLEDSSAVRLMVGDGIDFIMKLAPQECQRNINYTNAADVVDAKFDVLMVDMDSADPKTGIIAPPLLFFQKPVIYAAKFALCERGVLVINVILPNTSFMETLKILFKGIFPELYKIEVENEDDYILVAPASPIKSAPNGPENAFHSKLKGLIHGFPMKHIQKL